MPSHRSLPIWALAPLLLSLVGSPRAAEPAPVTRFVHEPTGDGPGIQPAWAAELDGRLPEVAALWATTAPPLAEAVTAATGQAFTLPTTVYLTLGDRPSNAFFGVTVNMRFALRSFTAAPVPLRYKIDTVFHEALHDFVARHTPAASPLLALQRGEPACVRKHLHLLALQKDALIRTHDTAALEQVIAIDSQLPSGCYRRAWEVVNAAPGTYLAYVAELTR